MFKAPLALPLSLRGYLAYQAVGSMLVNAAITFAFIWPMRHAASIPAFGGSGSVAFDTLLTAVLLSALTVISGSWFVRRDCRRGLVRPAFADGARPGFLRWFPLSTPRRALVFAVVFTLSSVPLALSLLAAIGSPGLSFREFTWFKLSFAVGLGAIVTPLNAVWVLARPSLAQSGP